VFQRFFKILGEFYQARKNVRIWLIGLALIVFASLALTNVLPENLLLVLSVLILLAFLVFYRYSDSHRMKQKTYAAMSPEMRQDIDAERRRNLDKRQKFLKAMDHAGRGGSTPA
jgi:hypothetical protein